MAGANRIVIPEFPLALPKYDLQNEGRFRKLVRDGFAGVEEYTGRAIREYGVDEATPPADGDVLTWDGTNNKWSFGASTVSTVLASATFSSDLTLVEALTLEVPATGWYSLTGCLDYYATTADDAKFQVLYNDTGAGSIIYDQGTNTEVATGEGSSVTINGASAQRMCSFKGMLDIQSIGSDPTLQFLFSLNTDTGSNNVVVYAGSWMTITRVGDT